jgi:energy-coupling factor transporter ATP-binding protein EcfA2
MMSLFKITNWRNLYLALSMTMWGFGIGYWAHIYFNLPLWAIAILSSGVGIITYFLPTWGLGIADAIASVFLFLYYPILPALYMPELAREVFMYGAVFSPVVVVATIVILIDTTAVWFIYASKDNWRLGFMASTATLTAFANPMLSAFMLLYATSTATPVIVLFLISLIMIVFLGTNPFGYMTPYQPSLSLAPILYVNAWVYILLLLVAVLLILRAFQMAEEKRDMKKAKYMYYASVILAVIAGAVLVDRYEWLALTSAPMLVLLLDNTSQIEFAYKQTALETYKEAKLPIGSFVDWDILKNEGEMILGYDDVKEDMKKTAEEFVKAMSKGMTWGHGILFTGPTGTGKTALGHYFAYLVREATERVKEEYKKKLVEYSEELKRKEAELESKETEVKNICKTTNKPDDIFPTTEECRKTLMEYFKIKAEYEEIKKKYKETEEAYNRVNIDFKAVRIEAKDLLSAFWGETQNRINELFAWATMNGGIIIMDEAERITWARTQYVSDDYTPKVASTLGDALDNPLVRNKPFLLIMTTNMPQLIDAMFKRPGRVFRVFNIGEMDDVRKDAVIKSFEERYGITLSPKERRELKELIVVGDDARFYFECRRNDSPHDRCMNYIKSVVETRKQTQQTPIVL